MANLTNREVAALLTEFARRSEPGGANPFSAHAYRRAAASLIGSPISVGVLIANKQLAKLPGIGNKIAGTITVLYQTGTHPALENMRARQIKEKGSRAPKKPLLEKP